MFTSLPPLGRPRRPPSESLRPGDPERRRRLVRAGLAALALLATGGCARDPDPYPGREIVLCYRTLADVSCYDRPDPGREGRLVGFWLRVPGDPRHAATALAAAVARALAVDR